MIPAQFALIVIAVFLAMEGVAWASHRWIMHGWGWGWHQSHHEPRTGLFERNDLYAVVGSAVGFGLFLTAWLTKSWLLYALASGVTLYGLAYAIFHDGLVHQRWPFRWVPKGGYLRRLIQAHRLHHAVMSKGGAVSFGFLIAPDPKALAAELKALRAARHRQPLP
ncbi:sterol desaturase family protein [Brevundimonas goettingensis]|uniref:Sterol desaturase family protein n=1 Tax=Brevundimonas goettingensis TaxID=2774190 RepID=A0A975GWN6_9CAUL|nr:sterol desaturase family protein [Brevundimonas goettingensis]QTC89680.1 sterol desaturase family protein [Brevundimonas goettingensis]